MKNWLPGLDYEVGVVSDLAYGALAIRVMRILVFGNSWCKDVGIEFYTFSKPLIWQVGVWHLRVEMLK
mgnify:CR=1 FL=1